MSTTFWKTSLLVAGSTLALLAAGCSSDQGTSARASNDFWAGQAGTRLTTGNSEQTVSPAQSEAEQPYALTGDEGLRATMPDWSYRGDPRLTVGNGEISVPPAQPSQP